jgi:hypothetical protein
LKTCELPLPLTENERSLLRCADLYIVIGTLRENKTDRAKKSCGKIVRDSRINRIGKTPLAIAIREWDDNIGTDLRE